MNVALSSFVLTLTASLNVFLPRISCSTNGIVLIPRHCMKDSALRLLRYGLLCVTFGFFYGGSSAQQRNDSLLATFRTISSDSLRIDSMFKVGFKLSFSEPMLAKLLSEQVEADPWSQGKPKVRLRAINLRGVVYYNINVNDLALQHFSQMLHIADSIGYDKAQATAWNNIGNIQDHQGRHAEALESYRNARGIFIKIDSKASALIAWTNIAGVYLNIKQYGRAIEVCDSALQEIDDPNDTRSYGAVYGTLGEAYEALKDYRKAIYYHDLAIDIMVQSDDRYFQALQLEKRAQTRRLLKDLDAAEADARLALQINLELEAKESVVACFNQLAMIMKEKGDANQALTWMEKSKALTDSLKSEENKTALANYQALYEVNQKDAQIDLLSKNKEVQAAKLLNVWYLFGLVSVVVLALVLVVIMLVRNNRSRRSSNNALQEKNAQIIAQHQQISHQNTALTERNEELNRLNHEMTSLVHVVAHDLKAPLHQLAGLYAVVEDEGSLLPQQARALAMAKKVTQNAGSLVQNLIELEGSQEQGAAVHKVAVPLKPLIAEVAAAFSPEAARKALVLETLLPEEDIVCHTEPQRLRRVLENLVSNALKFSPSGKKVRLSLTQETQFLCLTVEDEGPGISPADQQHLYRKFHKLSARPTAGESSSGLGLAIVKTLVEQLGGDITLHSEVGFGARFVVRIPR
jgi:signal transduction histidine kinase